MLKYRIKSNYALYSVHNMPIWLTQPIQIRNRHNQGNNAQPNANVHKTFQSQVKMRQDQAKRSILIEANGKNTINDLSVYCTKHGRIRNMYQTDADSKSYLLVEFDRLSVINDIIKSAYHYGNHFIDGKVRARGRFLTFTSSVSSVKKSANIRRELNIVNREEILKLMKNEQTIDEQIMKLYNSNRLSDLSSRLRFLTAIQMEDALSGIFYEPKVLPFGSSINGFGQMQSDLDMVLVGQGNREFKGQLMAMALGNSNDTSRNTTRNNLFVLSTIARHWLHGVTEVTPVLNARVPIIKYVQSITNLDCDLSMGNISGYQMSEILYTFGELDNRVQPFVFYIRAWAKEFDIIQSFPAIGLSNFMLTCLAIYFLQRLPKPILPPAANFFSIKNITEDRVTDLSKLTFKTENTSTLAELVMEFFDYYSSFDFKKDAISIETGTIKANISADPMYIYNLLDPDHNVSRNLNDFERNQFIEKCRISRDAMATSNIDAVGLLEYFRQHLFNNKLNHFVNNMKPTKGKNPSVNVKSLMS